MNESVYGRLVEIAARRKPTPDEEARLQDYLNAHPDSRADWEAEVRLTDVLQRLPDPPLASNFTSRVLHKVQRVQRRREHARLGDWVKRLIARIPVWQTTTATMVLGLALLVQYQHGVDARARVARSVAAVSTMKDVPSVEVLLDFDSINRLPAAPMADEDGLLAALE